MIADALRLHAFVRAGFMRLLAYRLRYVTGILTYTLNVSVYYFIWKAVYAGNAPDVGYALPEIITYVSLGWITRSFYFNNIDREIASLVAEGHITAYLTRPVNLVSALTGLAAGESLFRLTAFTAPITIVIVLLFPVGGPADVTAFLGFITSAVLSFLILAQINFLVGLIAFATTSVMGIISAKHWSIQLLSGLLMPLAFFPDWLQALSAVLPFRHIAHTPAVIYLGRVNGTAILSALALQLSWAVVLFAASRLAWNRQARRLVIQGG